MLQISRSTILLVTFFALTAGPARAKLEGGMDGGGGDPLANEFLLMARAAGSQIEDTDLSDLSETRESFFLAIERLSASLEGKDPLLVFPPGRTIDCFGSPKLGCVIEGKIRVARDGWTQEATLMQKAELSLIEVFMFMGLRDRYEKAQAAIKKILVKGTVADPNDPEYIARCKKDPEYCPATYQRFGTLYISPESALRYAKMSLDAGGSAVEVGEIDKVCLRRRRLENGTTDMVLGADPIPIRPKEKYMLHAVSYNNPLELPMASFRSVSREAFPSAKRAIKRAREILRAGKSVRISQRFSVISFTVEALIGSDPECIQASTPLWQPQKPSALATESAEGHLK